MSLIHDDVGVGIGELGVSVGKTGIGRDVTARRVLPGDLGVVIDDYGVVSGKDLEVTSVRRRRDFFLLF